MMTVWKFELEIEAETLLHLPEGAKPLCVGVQGDKVILWAALNSSLIADTTPRTFCVFGTGQEAPKSALSYIGTAFMNSPSGNYVWHVYEV